MDVQYFFNVLKKRKWLIVIPMFLTAIATYIFVDRQPEVYDAKASVATGIVEITGMNVKENSPFLQKMQMEISFANLIKFITTDRTTRFLSYELLAHDLLADTLGSDPPFKMVNIDHLGYSDEELRVLAYALKQRIDTLDSALDQETDIMYRQVAKEYEYDVDFLKKEKFFVKRDGETDALEMKYVDGNPKSCSFAINNFCQTLKLYHQKEQKKGDLETYDNYYRLSKKHEQTLRNLEKELENYNSSKGILNIGVQSEETLQQIADLESQLEETNRSLQSSRGIITNLNNYLDENEVFAIDNQSNKVMNHKVIVNLNNTIKTLNDKYIASGKKDKNIENQLELNKTVLKQQTIRLSKEIAKNVPGMVEQGDNILARRVEAENEMIQAKETKISIEDELARLKDQRNAYVNDGAYIDNLRDRIAIADREYKITLGKVTDTNLQTISATHKLEPLDWADTPIEPIPDNKYLLSGFAGLVTGSLATVLLFLLALFDLSLNTPNQFQKFTNLNLLGTLNKVKDSNLDLKQLFATYSSDKNLENFKESLRKLRYMFEESNASTFLVTSTKEGEGKTFFILTLAYALTLKDKKILLIDTNFKNNTLTRMSNETIHDNLLHTRLIGENNLAEQFEAKRINTMFNLDNVDIIGNRGTSHSPSEFFAGRDFQNFMSELTENYDYIFLEGASLNKYSDTRELVGFVDKVVSVFSAESEIKDADKESIDYLLTQGDKFFGSVLNKIDVKNLN